MKLIQKKIIILLILVDLLILATDLSASYIKFIFLLVVIFSSFIYRKDFTRINITKDVLLGLVFYSYLLFGVSLGFVYGYNDKYTLINIILVLPVFIYAFINVNKLNSDKLLKVIRIVAFIFAVFSIIQFFFWNTIPFFHDVLNNSENLKLFSRSIDLGSQDGRSLRATGLMTDAYENGLFILLGLVLHIENQLVNRKNKLFFLLGLMIYLVAVYTTQTRNNYLQLLIILFVYFSIDFFKKHPKSYFFIMVIIYFGIIASAVYYAAVNPGFQNSVFSRVYSWAIIIKTYIINEFFSIRSIFGFARTQFYSDFAPPKNYWFIDNSLLSIYLAGGFLGVLLFFGWIRKVFIYLLNQYSTEIDTFKKSVIRTSIILFSIFFISGTMNVNIFNIYYIVPMMLIFKLILNKKNANESNSDNTCKL